MRLKNSFFYTFRESAKDEDSISSNLLVRSGMIKKVSAGVYSYLPLGLKALKNVEAIIREEMNKINSSEVLMPSLIPLDIFEKSGRVKNFGPSVFSLSDRYDKKYILGPTHEELFAIASTLNVKSYKDLPYSLYQFQNKFRDEARPRYGLIRVREFIMKDAYSFDKDLDGLDKSYNDMYNAYKRSFDRMNLNYKIVKADTGVMGGLLSEEFQAVSDIGEDVLVLCDKCDYASNIEVSECVTEILEPKEELKPLEELHTPNVGKIKDLVDNYNFPYEKMTKSMIYKTENEFILVILRSDDEVNEVKLQKLLGKEVELANEMEVKNLTNATVGFAGPINLNIKIIADNKIKNMTNFLVGMNKTDYHYINANSNRDFKVDIYSDIRNVKENDTCPKCGGKIYFTKGIEVGNTFKLGTKYSESMNLNYLDQDNKLNPVVMGSYGIGLGRCLSAIIEQHNDEKGIIFPIAIAPFKVAIVLIDNKNEEQLKIAEFLYNELTKLNIDTIFDDRDVTPGVKFNDMDLIGIPFKITVGKKVIENKVELKMRTKNDFIELEIKDVVNEIKSRL